MVDIPTRRVQPDPAAQVRDQYQRIDTRIDHGMLAQGDRGPAVEALQRRLRSFGVFHGKADGNFDRATKEAVLDFQRGAGITQDGVVGPQTLGAMKQRTMFVQDDFGTPAHKGQSGADVRRAEVLLKDLGMKPGEVDGVYDQKTQDAVNRLRAGDPNLADKGGINAAVYDRLQERAAKPLAQGSVTRGVRVVEQNLKRLGLNPGEVDTHYTARTKAAVANFQEAHGLQGTGIADRATRAALQKSVDALKPTFQEKLAQWQHTPPPNDYRRVQRDGQTINRRTDVMLDRAQEIMRKKFGHEGFNFSITQGSYSTGVAASAGTHDGGGAMDVHTSSYSQKTVDDMVKSLRMAGFAAWSRGRGADSFTPHIHMIAIGDREAAPRAKSQVQDYFNGGNGLANHASDPDRRLGRPVPEWAQRFDR